MSDTVYIRMALERRGPSLYVKRSEFTSFEERGIGVRAGKGCTTLVTDEYLQLFPTDRGPHFGETPDSRRAAKDWDYMLMDEYDRPRPLRCHVFLTKATWYGPRLVVDLKLPHLLPWPKECDRADLRDDVLANLRYRMDSAERHTGRRDIAVPGNVLAMLTDEEERRLFEEWRV